jgi:sec-independent protein translocase protein TatB
MFDVGFSEIVLILGLALLVLGPEKLPGLAAKIGRWTGRARSMARQLRAQLEQEVTLEELAKYNATYNATPQKSAQPSAEQTAHEPARAEFDQNPAERDTTPEAMRPSAKPPQTTSPTLLNRRPCPRRRTKSHKKKLQADTQLFDSRL